MKCFKVFFILVFLSSVACKKENAELRSSGIVGEWSWIQTFGGIAWVCTTPASSHTTRKLIFTADSEEYIYENDTLRSTYKISIHNNNLCFGNSSIGESFRINKDTLYFYTPDIIDGFSSAYKRIK